MNYKKIIYLVCLFLVFGLINPKISMAEIVDNDFCEGNLHIPYDVAYASICAPVIGGTKGCCSVGPSGACPYCTDVCSSSECNEEADWTKWKVNCDVKCIKNARLFEWKYNLYITKQTEKVCSTADKWNSSDSTLIRAGLCNCSLGGIYKACCDKSTGNLVSSSKVLVGGAYDADCPAGTMIWNGGANITKQWAIDTCKALSCTPDCSNSGNYCAGTTGNPSANGCGTCTGTKPLDYTNGACGAPNGQTYSTYNLLSSVTESSLCASGTLVWTDGPGPISGNDWNWNCVGTAGTCGTGVTANCSAIKKNDGVCGSANGQTYSANVLTDVVNGTQLCSSGTLVWTDGPGVISGNDWNWTCRGEGAGVNVACSAIKKIDGVCGSANGKTYFVVSKLTEPGKVTKEELCVKKALTDANWELPFWEGGPWTDGPGPISGNDWNWTCRGEGAGVNVACSAIKCTTVPPTFGACGLVGQNFSTTPTTGLCTYGTASAVTTGKNTYTWTCTGAAGTCPTTSGGVTNCSVIRDTAPTYSSMVVQNADGTTVVAETGGRNQICQTTFTNSSNPNLVRFVVTFTDLQGGGDINYAELGIGNKTYTATTFTVIGNEARAIFDVKRSDFTLPTNVLNIYTRAYDDHAASGVTSIAADTGRDFKFWDCNVPVSGRLYDGGASGSCSVATDYLTPAINTNFNTLDFTDSPTMNMSRSSENQYTGNLTWGKTYTATFNTDIAMQISGSGVKTTDVSSGTSSCPNSIAFNLNNAVLNPYSASPTLRVDFSGVVDQDSWYQTVGGGLMANNLITNRVPVTCITNCAMSVNNGFNTNGIVSSPNISNTGNSGVNKGSPNNWWINKNLAETNSEYSELLNQYFWKAGVGTTFTGDKNLSEIGTIGVNFVNGNLTVTNDNNINSGQFLMVIVNGNIIIQPNVTNLEGIFVSRNLNIGGSNATALTIEGMIKATQNVRVNRTFVNKRINNTLPAVRFVYRPDFIFSMPAAIAKQLTKWQWGN